MGTMPYSFRNKFGKYLSDPVKAVNVLSLFYLVYIAFLIASSLLPEPFSEAAGAMAWLLPMLLFFPFMLTPDVPRDTGTGECTVSAPGFSFGRRAALVTLILLLPALWVIMTVSAGTELLLGLAGASQENQEITGSFWSAVFSLALAPAVLEELIFRVFPAAHDARIPWDRSRSCKRRDVFAHAYEYIQHSVCFCRRTYIRRG